MIYNKDFQITQNFNLNEFFRSESDYMYYFEQEDKRRNQLNQNISILLKKLQQFRDLKNEPILILSGYRSPFTNARVGGVKNSFHMQCKAVDIHYLSFQNIEIRKKDFETLKSIFNGVLHYPKLGFFHLDIRPPANKYADWDWS